MQGDHSVIMEVSHSHLGIWLKLVSALLDRYPGASLMPFNEREMHLYIHGRDSIDGTFFDELVKERILARWYRGSEL